MFKNLTIVGSGPAGCMQALILSSLFPLENVIVLDKRSEHVRNHGLKIWTTTIKSIQQHLKDCTKVIPNEDDLKLEEQKSYYQHIKKNIEELIYFLDQEFVLQPGFQGPFISTKKICILLQSKAESIGKKNQEFFKLKESKVKFLLGKEYEVKEEHLLNNKGESNLEKILNESSIIFAAEGSHSEIRKTIFEEDSPKEHVIQYLIEIKLHMKTMEEKKEKEDKISSVNFSKESTAEIGEFLSFSVSPLLETGKVHVWNKGKDGTATLHILVEKKEFDALTNKTNKKGKMGGYANPYTRLREIPAEEGLRDDITHEVDKVIGVDNFDWESLKITTIPMKIYIAKKLSKVENEKLYLLVGDAAAGLIFIEGANNAIHTGAEWGLGLFTYSVKNECGTFKEIPKEIDESELKIVQRYNEAVSRIEFKKELINTGESMAKTTAFTFSKTSSLSSSYEEKKQYQCIDPNSVFYKLIQELDDSLELIQFDKKLHSTIHSFDIFSNCLENEAFNIDNNQKLNMNRDDIIEAIKKTTKFIQFIVNENLSKDEKIKKLKEFHQEMLNLTKKNLIELFNYKWKISTVTSNSLDQLVNSLENIF